MTAPEWAMMGRHALSYLLNPFSIGLILLTFMLVRVISRDDNRWVRAAAIVCIVGMFCASTGWLPHWMVDTLEKQHERIVHVDEHIRWVVVLGGGVYEALDQPSYELLSNSSMKRLLEGVRIYRQLPDAQLILSGGGAKHPHESVGARMNELAALFFIPADRRQVETKSYNTADEAIVLKQMLHDEPFYLVTSANHMPRAMALCKQQGLHPIAAPCDYTLFWNKHMSAYLPNLGNVAFVNAAWHEILGLLWGKIRRQA